MAQFRKKPVIVEAEQFLYEQDPKTYPPDMQWSDEHESYTIPTLEGIYVVSDKDWIITGVKGERYPCKPEIFELTYEPA